MKDDSNSMFSIQAETNEARINTLELAEIFGELKQVATEIGEMISSVFASMGTYLEDVSTQINVLTGALTSATGELQNLIDTMKKQQVEDQWSDWYSRMIDITALTLEMYTLYQTFLALSGAIVTAQYAQAGAQAAVNAVNQVAIGIQATLNSLLSFMASPIGLVVIGIAALIAIIALLVANWDTVKEVAENVWEWIKSVWNNVAAWFQEKILDPLVNGFKGTVNGIIGFINGMISAVISGINFIIRALNKVSFNVPDWVPGIGGMTIGFSINEIKAPQIPYLAKGAVLPANKPFLAMVGDQKHGTNIEAPLATIQEAVAIVMEDMIPAMMAGFEAVVNEQRVTRQVVENIQIGDAVIGQAADRYRRKMAVIRGN